MKMAMILALERGLYDAACWTISSGLGSMARYVPYDDIHWWDTIFNVFKVFVINSAAAMAGWYGYQDCFIFVACVYTFRSFIIVANRHCASSPTPRSAATCQQMQINVKIMLSHGIWRTLGQTIGKQSPSRTIVVQRSSLWRTPISA